MAKRLSLFLHTAGYLKISQIFYQVYYRVKKQVTDLHRYRKYVVHTIYPLTPYQELKLIPSQKKYLGKHRFSFINLEHQFDGEIDWNYRKYGKLWNYNLQYFDYLHDPSIPDFEKQEIIESYCKAILNRSVKPEPYPVSLCIVNWLYYYSVTGYSSEQFHKCLKLQVGYLEDNLEFHLLGNHLLENYISLYLASIALQDTQLLKKARSGLQKQLEEQILADGGHYECSPMYHSIILAKIVLVVKESEKAGDKAFTSFCIEKARDMLGWLQVISFKNGCWAHVNDATEGIAAATEIIYRTAAQIGLHPHPKPLSGTGYRMFRSGIWEVLADVGNIIPYYQPGHAHSDMLSVCIQHDNKPLLVDTGTSTYQVNERRMKERSTSAHNTVVINKTNQSEVWGGFRVGRRAKIKGLKETANGFTASHTGYEKKYGLTHTRSVSSGESGVTICDDISGKRTDDTEAVAFFHFDHSCALTVNQKTDAVVVNNRVNILFSGLSYLERCTYDQAVGFNDLREASLLKAYFKNSLTTTILSI